VDNAVNQAQKEVAQRFDFKGVLAEIAFTRAESKIELKAGSEMHMQSMWDVLQGKLIKRGVPVKNLDAGEVKPAGGNTYTRSIALKMALDAETAKKVSAHIKAAKLKKVQASIQGDQVRITSPDKDALQDAISALRGEEFGVELKFGNYR
jgi:cyclic-di-GMP-binding protein